MGKVPDKPEPDPDEPTPAQRRKESETARVFHRRFTEAREAGMPFEDAECFARSSIEIGALRKLVAGGCDSVLLGRILL